MKKVLVVLLVFVMGFGLVGCGGETPEQAVSKMLDAMKVADLETAAKYAEDGEILDDAEKNILPAEDEAMYQLLFKNLSYKILSSEEQGDKATVTAEITNTEMGSIIGEMFQELIGYAFSGLSEEEMEQKTEALFLELMSREDNGTITNTVTITLEKEEKSWKVNESDELQNALLGGLGDTIDDINDSFGGDDSELDALDE